MKGKFKEIVSKFPGWLDLLQKSQSFSRDQLQSVPDHGIYVFYDEKDQPLYVGRSDRMRKFFSSWSLILQAERYHSMMYFKVVL
jgi:hypothetical protein